MSNLHETLPSRNAVPPFADDFRDELLDELRQQTQRGALDWTRPVEQALRGIGLDLAWTPAQWARVPWYGPIEPLLARASVSDIFINQPGAELRIVEHGLHLATGSVPHPAWSTFIARQLLTRSGVVAADVPDCWPSAIVSGAVDRRLRYLLTHEEATPDGISISIRVLPERWRSLDALVADGVVPRALAPLLIAALDGGATLLIAGMGGSGKTTLAAALLQQIADRNRVIVIEEAAELPQLTDSVSIEVGSAGLSYAECVRASLRQKPQRLVVGEARGPEALALLWAAATGHPGIGTIHAPSVETALRNLELMAAQGDAPADAVRGLITSPSVQLLLLHIGTYGGKRQLGQVAELAPSSGGRLGDGFSINPIYQVDPSSGQARSYPVQYSLWGRGLY